MGSTPYFPAINGVFNDKAIDAICASCAACVFLSICCDDESCDDDKPAGGIFCKPVCDAENAAAGYAATDNGNYRRDVLIGCALTIPYGRDGLFHCEPSKHPKIQK